MLLRRWAILKLSQVCSWNSKQSRLLQKLFSSSELDGCNRRCTKMAPPEVRLGWSLLTNYLSKGKWKFNFEDDYYADTTSTGTCVIFAFSKLSIWQISLQSIVAFVAKLVFVVGGQQWSFLARCTIHQRLHHSFRRLHNSSQLAIN